MADFTFDKDTTPAPAAMVVFFGAVLRGRPKVSFGGTATEAQALEWLEARRAAYVSAIGESRSSILKNMNMAQRVTLEGLAT